jgi:hypothetical protein
MPTVQQAIRCNRAPRRVAVERFRKAPPATNTWPCATQWGVIVPPRGSSQCRALDSNSLFSWFDCEPYAREQLRYESPIRFLSGVRVLYGPSTSSAGDPYFPINSAGSSLTSRQFASGQFQVSFEAMMNGSPIVVDGAGLNQEQQPHNSFFDVYLSSRTTPTDPPQDCRTHRSVPSYVSPRPDGFRNFRSRFRHRQL